MLGCESCLVHVWCVYHVVCFFSIVPVSLRSWGFVRLRLVRLHPFVFFMDSFFFLAGFQARWSYPWNHYHLCYASLLALCHANATMPTICLSASQLPCQTSNSPCPSKPLIGYVTALLSPSYSVVSCRWSWRLLHDGQGYVGISQYPLFN